LDHTSLRLGLRVLRLAALRREHVRRIKKIMKMKMKTRMEKLKNKTCVWEEKEMISEKNTSQLLKYQGIRLRHIRV
jgi:hypothetical protein